MEKLRGTIEYLNQEIHRKNNAIEALRQNTRRETLAHYETLGDLKRTQAREKFLGVQCRRLQEQVSTLLTEKETLNSPLMNFLAILVLAFAGLGLAFVIANFAGAVTWTW